VPVEERRPEVIPPLAEPDQRQQNLPWNSNSITSDTQRVGPYNQPVWTTQRPFSTVRTYVLPPGQAQVEQWYRPRWKKDGSREDRVLEELAIGLPGRFQLDIYERWNIKEDGTKNYNANQEAVQIELRWAVADWGVIPLNPTLYAEWVQRGNRDDEPDKYEVKLLLAEEFFRGKLFWAWNANLEQEVGGAKETEVGWSMALSTTIVERKLMAGIEMWHRAQNVHGERSTWNEEFLIGPSFQWRPTNRTFLNVSPLFGTTHDSVETELYVIFGFQFGNRAGPSFGGATPASLGN
jgi:hypothetical protein